MSELYCLTLIKEQASFSQRRDRALVATSEMVDNCRYCASPKPLLSDTALLCVVKREDETCRAVV